MISMASPAGHCELLSVFSKVERIKGLIISKTSVSTEFTKRFNYFKSEGASFFPIIYIVAIFLTSIHVFCCQLNSFQYHSSICFPLLRRRASDQCVAFSDFFMKMTRECQYPRTEHMSEKEKSACLFLKNQQKRQQLASTVSFGSQPYSVEKCVQFISCQNMCLLHLSIYWFPCTISPVDTAPDLQ